MRLTEITYDNSQPIDGYGPGFFRIGGQVVEGPVIVAPTGVQPWGGYDDTASLVALADALDVLFIGTGAAPAYLPEALRDALAEAGLGVEAMASPAACRSYNILLSEGRRIGVALLPV